MSKKRIIILSILLSVITLLVILFGVVFCLRKVDVNPLNAGDQPLTIHLLDENNEIVTDEYDNAVEQTITNNMLIQASGLKKGTPIFTINKEKIANNIETKYPSLKVVQIKTVSAIRVQIIVRQREGVYYLKMNSDFNKNVAYYILDEELVILNKLGKDYSDEVSEKYTELVLKNENINTVRTCYDKLSNESVQACTSNVLNAICSAVRYKQTTVEEDNLSYIVSNEEDAIYVERNTISKIISKITLTKAYVDDRFKDIAKDFYWITIQLTEGKYIQIYRPDKDLLTKINLSFASLSQLKEDRDTIVCDYHDGSIRLYQKSSS